MKFKLLSFVVCVCMLVSIVFATPVSALTIEHTGVINKFNSSGSESSDTVAFITQKFPDALYDSIYQDLIDCKESIDVEKYDLYEEDVMWVFSAVVNNNPDLFYIGDQFGYGAYSSGKVVYIVPQYKYSGSSLATARADYNARLDTIAARFDYLSDVEAVVAVNDYLATHYEYDSYGLSFGIDYAIRDAYTMLLEKRGVCQAYALLFTAIMDRLDINSTSVVSVPMNHQWNLVELDGEWYHIDVTWDDPTGVPSGYTYHDYMLHSDIAMSSSFGHYDWIRIDNKSEQCTSTLYDDWSWTETNTQLTPHNNKWYYANNTADGIEIVEISSEGRRVVHTQKDIWNVWDNPNYVYTNSLTTSTWYGNWMLYHSQDKLYCYDTVLNKTFYLTDLNVSSGYVYYIHNDEDVLDYVVSASPTDFSNAIHISLNSDLIHYAGDVDGDGSSTSADVLKCALSLLGLTDDALMTDADCDGAFTSADLLVVQQTMLGVQSHKVIYN